MRSASPLLALAIVAAIGLTACSSRQRPPRDGGSGVKDTRLTPALMFSPNGEPLNGGALGQPSCSLAMNYWFNRTDANRDGRLDREEFLADARAQFAKMDVNHQGTLTNDALSRYRQPFRQGTRSTEVIDPVMTADKNLNFIVTPEEFEQHAAAVFTQMAAPQGGIERAGLAAYCAQQTQSTGTAGDSRRPPAQGGPGGGRP